MDIGFALFRDIIVYNTRHRRDIKPPGCNICRHQHLDITFPEFIHDGEADILRLVSMQRTGTVVITPQGTIKVDDLALGIAENDRGIIGIVIKDPAQCGELLMHRQRNKSLVDIRYGCQPF